MGEGAVRVNHLLCPGSDETVCLALEAAEVLTAQEVIFFLFPLAASGQPKRKNKLKH